MGEVAAVVPPHPVSGPTGPTASTTSEHRTGPPGTPGFSSAPIQSLHPAGWHSLLGEHLTQFPNLTKAMESPPRTARPQAFLPPSQKLKVSLRLVVAHLPTSPAIRTCLLPSKQQEEFKRWDIQPGRCGRPLDVWAHSPGRKETESVSSPKAGGGGLLRRCLSLFESDTRHRALLGGPIAQT